MYKKKEIKSSSIKLQVKGDCTIASFLERIEELLVAGNFNSLYNPTLYFGDPVKKIKKENSIDSKVFGKITGSNYVEIDSEETPWD